MDKFVIRKSRTVQESSPPIETFDDSNPQNLSKRCRIDLENLPSDPGLRQKILSYHPNDRDEIRRAYRTRLYATVVRFTEVSSFCSKHNILFPNMSEMFVSSDRPQRKTPQIIISHRYRVDQFYTILNMQLQELNNRFTEGNTELLLCMACLNPRNSFFGFDRKKLIRLAELYSSDFSKVDLMALDIQLQNFIVDTRSDEKFYNLKGIGDLAAKLVETEKHVIYRLVYRLVTLVLTLPVATATIERSFSAMKYIKRNLCNQMGDQWMNDCLVTYIERDVFDVVDNDAIMQRFQNMKSR